MIPVNELNQLLSKKGKHNWYFVTPVPREICLILWFRWQNCSPQSSESTEPPGSPQECDPEVTQASEPLGPAVYTQAPAYVYPGYMFGPPVYSVNGK